MTTRKKGLTPPTRPVWVAAGYLDTEGCRLRGVLHEPPGAGWDSRVLVFKHGVPQVWLDFPLIPSPGEVEESYRRVVAKCRDGEGGVYSVRANALVGEAPSCTVAICTRERPHELQRCLTRLVESVQPDEEILVIDNAPRTSATSEVVAEFQSSRVSLRRVVEPIAGLSRARNRALGSASGEIVVFLDDDTLPEPGWTVPLRAAFRSDPAVIVATGLVPPATLETEGQKAFQSRLHWSDDLIPKLYSLESRRDWGPLFPFAAGRLGTGANMAVRRRALSEAGGFDRYLGAGTPSRGGEDLEIFVRILRQGWSLAYVPSSVVWHVHSEKLETTRQHMFGYGSGVTAYLAALLRQPGKAELLRRIPAGIRYVVEERRGSESSEEMEFGMLLQEVLGFVWGPFAYARSAVRGRHELD